MAQFVEFKGPLGELFSVNPDHIVAVTIEPDHDPAVSKLMLVTKQHFLATGDPNEVVRRLNNSIIRSQKVVTQ